MESHQVTVILTREIVESAARNFLWRFVRRNSISDLIFIGIGITLGAIGIIGPGLVTGCLLGGIGLILLVVLVAWNYVRLARSKFSAMSSPEITYTFAADTIRTTCSLGLMEVPWKSITEVWKFDDVWLLFFGRHGYSTFPVTAVPSEMATFLEDRVKANGGKVG